MIVRTLINILIVIMGPLVTIWLTMKSKGESEGWGSFYLAILIFSVITIVVAIAVYLSRNTFRVSIIKATIYSMSIYVVLTCSYVFFFDPSGIGWLVIVIPVMLVVDSPMAFSVSLGTIRILEDMRMHKDKKAKKENN